MAGQVEEVEVVAAQGALDLEATGGQAGASSHHLARIFIQSNLGNLMSPPQSLIVSSTLILLNHI